MFKRAATMNSVNRRLMKLTLLLALLTAAAAHEAKDFDDSILYKIDFEVPELIGQPVSTE